MASADIKLNKSETWPGSQCVIWKVQIYLLLQRA